MLRHVPRDQERGITYTPKGGATINPIDHSATEFEALHRAFQPGQSKIEDLITHLNSMCNLLLEFTDKDTTGQADTSYAARIEFISHELELCGSDFKKPMDLYEKKEWKAEELIIKQEVDQEDKEMRVTQYSL